MQKQILVWLAVILGLAFVAVAFVYWTTPASALPSYFPGYDPAMSGVHLKHGIASFILALGCFAYAWFGSKKRQG